MRRVVVLFLFLVLLGCSSGFQNVVFAQGLNGLLGGGGWLGQLRLGQAHRGRQAGLGEQPLDAIDFRLGKPEYVARDFRRRNLADRDCFAVQIFSITRDGLERVADGMPIVQNSAQPALALVLRDDLGLDLATVGDDVRRALGVEPQQPRQRALEPAEQCRVVNDSVLDHLGEPGSQLALGQRLERVEVAQHKARLVKCADQVFASLQVHADLAAEALGAAAFAGDADEFAGGVCSDVE